VLPLSTATTFHPPEGDVRAPSVASMRGNVCAPLRVANNIVARVIADEALVDQLRGGVKPF
jgi:hypothetical protein